MNVLAILEQRQGNLKRQGAEVLGAARRLARAAGGRVAVMALGPGAREAAAKAIGADQAVIDAGEVHASLNLQAAADAAAKAVKSTAAEVVLLAGTAGGAELAPMIAADLRTSVAADAIEIDWRDGTLQVKRPVYAGKALAVVRFRRLPAVVTLRPNVFPAEPGGDPAGDVTELIPAQPDASWRVVETIDPPERKVDLTEADIIVSGGRGLKGPEGFAVLESLARALGGVVGASRAVCDAGWRPHSDQVGQTGKTVSPRLYLACGISGAIQHLAGMSSSRTIVAINKDPNAPIFQVADYGVVGDLFEIVPAIEAEVKKSS